MEAQRGSPGEVGELRLKKLSENLAGRFVLMHVPPPTNPLGAMGELVGVGVPKRPFDCFGHLVGVNCGKSGKGEALGLGLVSDRGDRGRAGPS
ncbi:MAG TPA: hypothetical protein VMV06_11390 [Acidimicrobiales bacterium]|nr:hypothetical protein [Acidimicrobiales bacterium]